ncbi:tyrosine-protein phosphatase 3-like isoform X2 [Convolutriloba macropyga]|uniref:tyrosine-protein phosphatase 3-like isoform X2 n=1 Tax=Convolutriloba macropyga TaxID=536237 RepID=UPI003F525316
MAHHFPNEVDPFVVTLQKVQSVFEKISQKNAEQEFQLMELESGASEMPSRLSAVKGGNFKKNRYRDILPFDYNRVTVDAENRGHDDDYINASYITDYNGLNLLIASQAPLSNTVHDFWLMCWTNNVSCIVMLCDFYENGKKKCEQYFPTIINEPFDTDRLTIELESCTPLFSDLTIRHLVVTSLIPSSSGRTEKRKIKHVQYTGWPDFGITGHFNKIEAILDNLTDFLQDQPMMSGSPADYSIPVVHCSAGCGRTGTIASLLYIAKLIHNKELHEEFSLVDLVLQLRRERQNMVQTKIQYAFLCEYVAQWMLKKEIAKYSNKENKQQREHLLPSSDTLPEPITTTLTYERSGEHSTVENERKIFEEQKICEAKAKSVAGESHTYSVINKNKQSSAPQNQGSADQPQASAPDLIDLNYDLDSSQRQHESNSIEIKFSDGEDKSNSKPIYQNALSIPSRRSRDKHSASPNLRRRSPLLRENRSVSPTITQTQANPVSSNFSEPTPTQSPSLENHHQDEKSSSSKHEGHYISLSDCSSGVSEQSKSVQTTSKKPADSGKPQRLFAGILRNNSSRFENSGSGKTKAEAKLKSSANSQVSSNLRKCSSTENLSQIS